MVASKTLSVWTFRVRFSGRQVLVVTAGSIEAAPQPTESFADALGGNGAVAKHQAGSGGDAVHRQRQRLHARRGGPTQHRVQLLVEAVGAVAVRCRPAADGTPSRCPANWRVNTS